ncbi:pimeloyl-ACP methyl ester carboxylesterase [Nocardioides thalensis]|uniref:Pimeloyl-ACP methyl ester carboxylesterase n=1 Tax=Nocardioides thalensis TaxID=1914755 RepID=A0A853BZ15_9ACTN|nr:lipase family protein [Nocardioides thalensis]NYI99637.1 pimeloyl-ACP methyl ester carboxylesterase [Nocardioides thalensis]
MRRYLAVLVAVALIGWAAPGAGEAVQRPRTTEVPVWAGMLKEQHLLPTDDSYPPGTLAWRVEYYTTTPDGGPTSSSGLVLVPPGPAPAGGWPVVAWDHGTTGIDDGCAPSAIKGAAYGGLLSQILAAGYVVAATDYPGLGTAGVHPYLISESEARATVDSVRAARSLLGNVSSSWVAAGHSQGGQAAVATAEIADDYDGLLQFAGAAAFAPAPNMTRYVDAIASPHPLEQQFYTMMLVGIWTQHPELRWADYLGPRARALLPEVLDLCFDDLTQVFVQAALPASEFEPVDQAAVDRLRAWFRESEVGHRSADGPLLVMQGTADHVVPVGDTQEMVEMSRSNGSTVDLRVYDGATHGSVLDLGAADLLAWLDAQL